MRTMEEYYEYDRATFAIKVARHCVLRPQQVGFALFQKLIGIEPVITPLLFQQVVMRAMFGNPPMFQHKER